MRYIRHTGPPRGGLVWHLVPVGALCGVLHHWTGMRTCARAYGAW